MDNFSSNNPSPLRGYTNAMAVLVLVVSAVALTAAREAIPKSGPIWRRADGLEPRIVGGIPANIKDFPFMVSVQRNGMHTCGGSILTRSWVLSAAHCFVDLESGELLDPSVYSALAGTSSSLAWKAGEASKQKRRVHSLAVHPRFSIVTAVFDIGAALLANRLDLGEAVAPVPLPPSDSILPGGHRCVAVGWGHTEPLPTAEQQIMSLTSGPEPYPSPELRMVVLPIVDVEQCRMLKPELIFLHWRLQMCTLASFGEVKDSCNGDSGGPLLCDDVAEALVSAGDGCAQPGMPGLYCRLGPALPWLRSLLPIDSPGEPSPRTASSAPSSAAPLPRLPRHLFLTLPLLTALWRQ